MIEYRYNLKFDTANREEKKGVVKFTHEINDLGDIFKLLRKVCDDCEEVGHTNFESIDDGYHRQQFFMYDNVNFRSLVIKRVG
jgi:hypothetical protein